MIRYAMIRSDSPAIAAYLPSNYTVLARGAEDPEFGGLVTIIEGTDHAGWTLSEYVLPRLASGLYSGYEIDLSHPVMRSVPA